MFLAAVLLVVYVVLQVSPLPGLVYFGSRNDYSLNVHREGIDLATNESFLLRMPAVLFLIVPVTYSLCVYAVWSLRRKTVKR